LLTVGAFLGPDLTFFSLPLENFRYFTLNDSFTGCKSLADIYLPERLRHIDNVIPKEFKNIVFHVPVGSKTEKLMKENNIPFVAE
jgi:hypothetical protein